MASISYQDSDVYDVLIIGAGISGINAAYRIHKGLRDKKFLLFEARDDIGGTWDLFRYPGIRSDSDLHTFSFPFKEWTGTDIAEGKHLVAYLKEVVQENGLAKHLRFRSKVQSADWSTEQRWWFVTVNQQGQQVHYRTRFLYCCTGYYDYDSPYKADIPGIHNFKGKVVHPQFWNLSEDDYRCKRVAVIGSGATAITLIPSMASVTSSLTLIQRSPSYILSMHKIDPMGKLLRAILPRKAAAWLTRQKNIVAFYAFYHTFLAFPNLGRRILLKLTQMQLPSSIAVDPHFKPNYNPWDQRLCVSPDGDFFQTLREGKARVATGHIDQVTDKEIILQNGERIPCDIIVTATGIKLHYGGHIAFTVDQAPVHLNERFLWRSCMMEGVPNYIASMGYTNASWTLGTDCTAQHFVRLVKHMDKYHKSMVVPTPRDRDGLSEERMLKLDSGYVKRGKDAMPKVATSGPWKMRNNYWYDLFIAKWGLYSELCFG